MKFRPLIKKLLVHSPIPYSQRLDSLLRLTLLKSWLKQQQPHPHLATREHLYAHIAEHIGNVPITFLEFGVYQGASLQSWLSLNTAVQSQFTGFDSFAGLPETWINVGKQFSSGTFSTAGQLPAISDPRARFIKGWFQDSLPPFLAHFSSSNPLIIHCDADLYASTLYVLCQLHNFMPPGTIILFDDFSSMLHDFRAWQDYSQAFGRRYQLLAAASRSYYEHVALQLTAG